MLPWLVLFISHIYCTLHVQGSFQEYVKLQYIYNTNYVHKCHIYTHQKNNYLCPETFPYLCSYCHHIWWHYLQSLGWLNSQQITLIPPEMNIWTYGLLCQSEMFADCSFAHILPRPSPHPHGRTAWHQPEEYFPTWIRDMRIIITKWMKLKVNV